MTRKLIKKTAEALMYRNFLLGITKHVPQGFEFYFDLRKLQLGYNPKIVFDVGANIGQTAIKWHKFFPEAQYHCFEPVGTTMAALKENTSRFNNILYYQCALGAEKKQAEITLCQDSSLNSFVDAVKKNGHGTEVVQINTLDELCRSKDIFHIDVLKIDTEGFDIEVLKGSSSMLKAGNISFIQVEAGMNPYNHLHVPLHHFVDFLTPYGYILFGIYEQHLEWTGEKRLSFCNPVFISEKQSVIIK